MMNIKDKNISDSVLQKVRAWIGENRLLSRGDRALCALSGGADSVCMLLALLKLRDELGLRLAAAHVNHRLRGAEADRDAEFCRRLCGELSVPFSLLSGDAAALAREKGLGIEEAARELRYSLLKRERDDGGFSVIATAHNLEDNLETVLLNLIRGAGTRGLSGIPPANAGVIRPILPLSRSETEGFCRENGREFVIDSTNSEEFCQRNLLRARVVPVLKGQNPAAARNVLENGAVLRAEDEYLNIGAAAALARLRREAGGGLFPAGPAGLDAEGLCALHPALAARALRLFAAEAGILPDREKTFRILSLLSSGNRGFSADFGGGKKLVLEYGRLFFEAGPGEPPGKIFLSDGFSGTFGGRWRVRVKKTEKAPAIYKLLTTFSVNNDTIKHALILRAPEPGDSFKRNPGSGTKKLSKLFSDMKIPKALRGTLPVIADERGALWVWGLGANKNFPDFCPDRPGLFAELTPAGPGEDD